jgi:hypothetical protein
MTLETIEWLSNKARRTSALLFVINKTNFNHQSVQTLVEQQSSYISYLKKCSSTQTIQTSTQLSLDWVCGLLTLRNCNCNCPMRSRNSTMLLPSFASIFSLWQALLDKPWKEHHKLQPIQSHNTQKGRSETVSRDLRYSRVFLLAKCPKDILEYTLLQAVQ